MIVMSPRVCGRPGCGRVLTDDPEPEKKFLVKATGQVLSLVRCEDCSARYAGPGASLQRVSADDLKKLLSPAKAMSNLLAMRRRDRIQRKPGRGPLRTNDMEPFGFGLHSE